MEAVLRNERVRSVSMTVVKGVAISITFAAVYYAICMANPLLATSPIGGISNTLRIANALRAFVLISPASAIGCGIGAQMFQVSTGKAALLSYPIQPMLVAGIYLLGGVVSQLWGRSTFKDITVLAVSSFIAAVLKAINLVAVAMLFHSATWGSLLSGVVLTKILIAVLVVLAGYPLVRSWEAYRGKDGPAQ
jgi:hypothetical protein